MNSVTSHMEEELMDMLAPAEDSDAPCGQRWNCMLGKTSLITRFMYDSFDNTYQNVAQRIFPSFHKNISEMLSGPGRLAVINGTMNSAVYQKILKENVRPSVCDLKLKRTWVLQQDNDPKHTSKSTSEWLKKNKMKTLEWPSQSPDLNPIEMLWHDLKKVVHARKPSNVAELQQFCKDEWAKIPPQRCNRLIASYGKRLIAVVAAKGGPTSY
ncbi:hypothetical protein QTP70_008296 [Hemibagrus guttatus]|uniref:Tc1-like transposase DDE domain-containing protein n=1 Tax=Hemibagrus guttatus TaxID=175788 RepID=A0AAE0RJJ2_9TELE|nr:hypothetical protein QTP70_008296 [Hemibagrus guttatus]